jgi:hypothetical protein
LGWSEVLNRLATVVGFVLICLGFCLVSWPAPLFTLNQPYLNWYIIHVLACPIDKDLSAGAALPFVWLFLSMPVGLSCMAIGVLMFHWGKA